MRRTSRIAQVCVLAAWVAAIGCAQIVGDDYEIVGHNSGNSVGVGPGDCDEIAFDCEDCGFCATSGPCSSEYQNCFMDNECAFLDSCYLGCQGDPVCNGECEATHPAGVPPYQAVLACIGNVCPCSCQVGC